METLDTTEKKKAALTALEKRREENKTRKRIDNSSLYAGSSMHFDCLSCGADISVPESYITRPKLCSECQAMKDQGFLE